MGNRPACQPEVANSLPDGGKLRRNSLPRSLKCIGWSNPSEQAVNRDKLRG